MGHSLALDHTDDSSAIMYAELKGQKKEVTLAEDDLKGIQALYGEGNGKVHNTVFVY